MELGFTIMSFLIIANIYIANDKKEIGILWLIFGIVLILLQLLFLIITIFN